MKKSFRKATLQLFVFTGCVLVMLFLFGLDQGFNNGVFLVPTFFTVGIATLAWVVYDDARRSTTNFVLDLWKNPKGADETAYELKKYSGDNGAQELIVFHVIERGKENILFARCFITRARELGLHGYANRVVRSIRPHAIQDLKKHMPNSGPYHQWKVKEWVSFFQNDLMSLLVVCGNNLNENGVSEAYNKIKAEICYTIDGAPKELLEQLFTELKSTKIIVFNGEEKEEELLQEMIRKIVKVLTLNNKMTMT